MEPKVKVGNLKSRNVTPKLGKLYIMLFLSNEPAPQEIPRQCGPEGGPVACDEEKAYFHNSFDKKNILYNLPNFGVTFLLSLLACADPVKPDMD